MIYKKQSIIKYGFIDFYGNQWCDQWVDTYNRFTRDINKSAEIEVKSGSLTEKERNFYLDQRHKYYAQCADIAKKSTLIRQVKNAEQALKNWPKWMQTCGHFAGSQNKDSA